MTGAAKAVVLTRRLSPAGYIVLEAQVTFAEGFVHDALKCA